MPSITSTSEVHITSYQCDSPVDLNFINNNGEKQVVTVQPNSTISLNNKGGIIIDTRSQDGTPLQNRKVGKNFFGSFFGSIANTIFNLCKFMVAMAVLFVLLDIIIPLFVIALFIPALMLAMLLKL